MLTLSLITVTHDRPQTLRDRAISSLLAQTDTAFEWVVINDGGDRATETIVSGLQAPFAVQYQAMTHPEQGFGLAQGRNLGLQRATGDLIAYLDDDNQLAPEFVAATKGFFVDRPEVKCSMVQQQRRRQVRDRGVVVARGQSFISPRANAVIDALIGHQELFDSNGFAHYRQNAPTWNPDYRIFLDYEYFLQCLGIWGRQGFRINPQVLVEYVQSSEGVIGQSSYGDWLGEMRQIIAQVSAYPVLTAQDRATIEQVVQQWQTWVNQGKSIAFSNPNLLKSSSSMTSLRPKFA